MQLIKDNELELNNLQISDKCLPKNIWYLHLKIQSFLKSYTEEFTIEKLNIIVLDWVHILEDTF